MHLRSLRFWEVVVALLVVALGAFMIWESSGYPFGNAQRMGPGFFPFWLGVLLMAAGAALVLDVRRLRGPAPVVHLRPMAAIVGGLLAFALIVNRFGLVPAAVALVVLSALGHRGIGVRAIVGTAIVVAAVGYFIFLRGFDVPLSAFRWNP